MAPTSRTFTPANGPSGRLVSSILVVIVTRHKERIGGDRTLDPYDDGVDIDFGNILRQIARELGKTAQHIQRCSDSVARPSAVTQEQLVATQSSQHPLCLPGRNGR